MTNNITVFKRLNHPIQIEQTKIQRDWMDETNDRHAYKCFPVSLSNSIGFSISFLEDIEFIWDGIVDTTPNHIKIIKGEDFCSTDRGNATISFHTGIYFKTPKNMSMLSIVPPNYFIDGAIPYTSIISTSFFNDPFPVAWRITRANHKILIPAKTPIATLIPISLTEMSKIELDLYDKIDNPKEREEHINKMQEWEKITQNGGFTNFYRDAVDYKGNKIGEHEVKSLRLTINDYTKK